MDISSNFLTSLYFTNTVDLRTLLPKSDFVVVCCALNSATKGMVVDNLIVSRIFCHYSPRFKRIMYFTIYKLGDVGISSNLIGSLSLTNGQCAPPGRWIMKQWPVDVNSGFTEVTEKDIL